MISDINEALLKQQNVKERISEITSINGFIPDCIRLAVHEFNDGLSDYSYSLTELFKSAAKEFVSSDKIKLESIPVTESIDSFPQPVILISDEQELDSSAKNIIIKRAENGYITFPVILFSEDFFKLRYGESSSYLSTIAIYEKSVRQRAMIFRKKSFRHLDEYLIYVSKLFEIYLCREVLNDAVEYISAEIAEYSKSAENRDSLSALIYLNRIKAMNEFLKDAGNIQSDLDLLNEMWNTEIFKLRQICDKESAETILNIKADKLSSFVLNIDLQYGGLQSYLQDFLNQKELNDEYDSYTEKIRRLVYETTETLNQNVVKLSVAGTFSSGKTTLINSFLGDREIPLRTSMGHNTSILTQLFYETGENEYYEIVYKDKLSWTIVKPEISDDKVIVNKENSDIVITSIGADKYRNWIVKYNILNSETSRTVRFRAFSPLIVKKGDILKPGEPFTHTEQLVPENVEICSKAEIQLIIEQVTKSNYAKLIYKDGTSENKNNILEFLEKAEKIALEKSSIISYNDFCKAMNLTPESSSISDKTVYSDRCRRMDIECEINEQGEKKILTKEMWINLFGDPENASAVSMLTEQPECYMLAKELHLHIHSEFLKYCSLTDTPGYGSVNEDNDEITESYIRNCTGCLMVMISVTAKTIDAKYRDLINCIDNIYTNYRADEKENVVFLLNCFSNLTNEADLQNQIDNVVEMLDNYGFNRENVFVMNLLDVLVDKKQTDTFSGYPSYNKFHDFIIRKMLSSDLKAKYDVIKDNWTSLFEEAGVYFEEQTHLLGKKLKNINEYCAKIMRTIRILEFTEIEDKPYNKKWLVDVYDEIEDVLLTEYTENRRGILENIRWNAICNAFDKVEDMLYECNEKLLQRICDYYQECADKISFLGESEIQKPDIIMPVKPVAVLNIKLLRDVLSEADDTTHWYNKGRKNNFYIDRVIEIVDADCAKTSVRANKLCNYFADMLDDYCNRIIEEKKEIIKSVESKAKMQSDLDRLNEIKYRLKSLENNFNKIKFI